MSRTKTLAASLAALAAAAVVWADVPDLVNTSFETENAVNPAQAAGWETLNGARYREVGDGLTPPALVRTGTHSMELPGNPTSFQFITSDEPIDPLDPLSELNFETIIFPGVDYKVTGWYAIPDGQGLPMDSAAGMKVEFRRGGTNFSSAENFEWLGIRGHDTDGQFVRFEMCFSSEQLEAINRTFPPGPARVAVLMLRAPSATGLGTIFFDDISFEPIAEGPSCPADFDSNGTRDVADIFAFLSAWFAGCP